LSRPSDERLREVFNLLKAHIDERYGIPVRINDVTDPFTGDLDGAEIHVDYDEEIESAVFIVAHLFGHTVQWNVCEKSRDIGSVIHENPSDETIAQLHEYETEACGYSMQLFHELGILDFDQWLSDFSACDLAYLTHFYKTGNKPPFRSLWIDDTPIIDAKPLPDFHPTKWISRWDGIVV